MEKYGMAGGTGTRDVYLLEIIKSIIVAIFL